MFCFLLNLISELVLTAEVILTKSDSLVSHQQLLLYKISVFKDSKRSIKGLLVALDFSTQREFPKKNGVLQSTPPGGNQSHTHGQ